MRWSQILHIFLLYGIDKERGSKVGNQRMRLHDGQDTNTGSNSSGDSKCKARIHIPGEGGGGEKRRWEELREWSVGTSGCDKNQVPGNRQLL